MVGIDGRRDDGWEPRRSRKTESIDKLAARYSCSLLVGESIRRLSAAEPKKTGLFVKKTLYLCFLGVMILLVPPLRLGTYFCFFSAGLRICEGGLERA